MSYSIPYSTAILRFRDLSSPTIIEHNKIIERYGYVWWGWWKKPTEQVDNNDFYWIAGVSQLHGLDIYLFDSASFEVYTAHCTGLYFLESGETCYSPEIEKTPDYYNSSQYGAWFRFSKIEKASFSELAQYYYLYAEDLFCEPDEDLLRYNGHPIDSPKDLMKQTTTIWFVSDRAADVLQMPVRSSLSNASLSNKKGDAKVSDIRKELFGSIFSKILSKCPDTQEKIANHLNVSTATVSKWTNGKSIPRKSLWGSIRPSIVAQLKKLDQQGNVSKDIVAAIRELQNIDSYLPVRDNDSPSEFIVTVLQNLIVGGF
jgi:DNA-binding transcriptional regulator YiaG